MFGSVFFICFLFLVIYALFAGGYYVSCTVNTQLSAIVYPFDGFQVLLLYCVLCLI